MPALLTHYYSKVLRKVYNVNINTELVCRAIADMTTIAAVLRGKTGIKKILLSSIEKSFGKLPMFSSMILPIEVKDSLDLEFRYFDCIYK
ncbi:MAG: hypothetical protein ACYCYE_00200 [Clostridia bacterium]